LGTNFVVWKFKLAATNVYLEHLNKELSGPLYSRE